MNERVNTRKKKEKTISLNWQVECILQTSFDFVI